MRDDILKASFFTFVIRYVKNVFSQVKVLRFNELPSTTDEGIDSALLRHLERYGLVLKQIRGQTIFAG